MFLCWDKITGVGYPSHEFISGECTRCGEIDPQMNEGEQEALQAVWNATIETGGYVLDGVPVPFSSTVFNAEHQPVVRRMPHGYEKA